MGSAERLARTWMASGRDEEVDQMVLGVLVCLQLRFRYSQPTLRHFKWAVQAP